MFHFNKIAILCTAVLFVFLPYHKTRGGNFPLSAERSARIINKIYAKYIPVYKKFRGIQSIRNIDIIEYNPNSNTLITRSHVSLIRKDYFYQKPVIEVLDYIENGRTMKPSDYQNKLIDTNGPILDESGRHLYMSRITGVVTVSGQRCYQMKIVPRKRSSKYFEGFLYFKTKTLDLLLMEGTLSELPFSFKEYSMKCMYRRMDALPVLKSGTVIMRTYIPILQPDRRFVLSINSIDAKLL
jgi:hypothetical protein